jgi:kynurenine formamidase
MFENIFLQPGVKALVIRTMPNTLSKLTQNYSGTNPPYLSHQAMQIIVDHGIEHLIVDLPSVDREQDNGKLVAHKTFWQTENVIRENATITELAFIPDSVSDGIYLLNLQVLPIHLDVSPSNPVLFALIQL